MIGLGSAQGSSCFETLPNETGRSRQISSAVSLTPWAWCLSKFNCSSPLQWSGSFTRRNNQQEQLWLYGFRRRNNNHHCSDAATAVLSLIPLSLFRLLLAHPPWPVLYYSTSLLSCSLALLLCYSALLFCYAAPPLYSTLLCSTLLYSAPLLLLRLRRR